MDTKDADMAVVDTFTRLIFGDGSDLTAQDRMIVQALRLVDEELVGDSLPDMGEHLASLEVAEMIELVSRVRERLGEGLTPAGDPSWCAAGGPLPAR